VVQLKVVDVAIGVAFLYLLLTFCASAFVELVSTTLNWRAQMLHDSIQNMLNSSCLITVRDIYSNPQVLALCRGGAARTWVDLFEPFGWRIDGHGTPPSYIAPDIFSGAVLDGLMHRALDWGVVRTLDLSPLGTIQLIQGLLNAPPGERNDCTERAMRKDALRAILETTLATQGASIQALRFSLEHWFNDTMDRTSGWYKRRSQACLLMIGICLAFSCNVNTITVARWLWEGDAARQAAISAATTYVNQHPSASDDKSAMTLGPKKKPEETAAIRVTNVAQQLSALSYPIGWYSLSQTSFSIFSLFTYIAGALITGIAISMGSTFWFDAVQSLIKLRGTGPKPNA
jgi:hypothetical protein